MPQSIVVDGVAHGEDARRPLTKTWVDAWIRKGRAHPTAVAPEPRDFLRYFGVLAQRDPDILAVLTSRKLSGPRRRAHRKDPREEHRASAEGSAHRGGGHRGHGRRRRTPGAGRGTGAQRRTRARGRGAPSCEPSRAEWRTSSSSTCSTSSSGAAAPTSSKAVTGFLDVRPMLSLVEGELRAVGKRRAEADLGAKLGEYFAEKLAPGTAVWAAVAHGATPSSRRRSPSG